MASAADRPMVDDLDPFPIDAVTDFDLVLDS